MVVLDADLDLQCVEPGREGFFQLHADLVQFGHADGEGGLLAWSVESEQFPDGDAEALAGPVV